MECVRFRFYPSCQPRLSWVHQVQEKNNQWSEALVGEKQCEHDPNEKQLDGSPLVEQGNNVVSARDARVNAGDRPCSTIWCE